MLEKVAEKAAAIVQFTIMVATISLFFLTVYGKGAAANLTKAERNALTKILPVIGDAYRETTKKLAAQPSKQRPKEPNQ